MNLFLCALSCLLAVVAVESRELAIVHAVWRHGDRAPTMSWPTNTNGPDALPVGQGQLTADGMNQQFELGTVIAERYKDFIGAEYDPTKVYVKTTAYDRTVMSALSNLAGSFKATPGKTCPNNPDWPGTWRPISLYNTPAYQDNICQMYAQCPMLQKHYAGVVLPGKRFTDFWAKEKEFITWMQEKTGFDVPGVSLEQQFFYGYWHGIIDAILVYKHHNLPIPDWVTDEKFHHMEELSKFWFWLNFEADDIVRKYVGGGGSLVKDIVGRMGKKIACLKGEACDKAVKNIKYYVYSSHDTTVTAYTSASGAFSVEEQGLPGYTGCVVVELWKEDDGSFSVEQYYRQFPKGDGNDKFVPIKIGSCEGGKGCPFGTVQKDLAPIMPSDWISECESAELFDVGL